MGEASDLTGGQGADDFRREGIGRAVVLQVLPPGGVHINRGPLSLLTGNNLVFFSFSLLCGDS